MTRKFDLTLTLKDTEGKRLLHVEVNNKTIDTVQQLVRLSMSDFEKTEKRIVKQHKPVRVDVPIEPLVDDTATPTAEDIASIIKET